MAFRPSFSAPGSDNTLSSHPADYDWRRLSDQTGQMAYNASRQSINDAQKQALAAAAGINPDAEMKANRDRITALTEGRSTELANDPRMNQAMDFFGSVLNGSKVPFSEETQRAQLNQQANGTAAANAAQLRALEEAIVARGGSLQDPSFLAQKQEMMSSRQGQNLDALGQMLSQAGIANYNAQAQGANALAGIRSGQNNQINQMNLAGAGYRAQDFRDVPTGGGGGSSTTSWSTGPMIGQGAPPPTQVPMYQTPSYVAPPPRVATRPTPTAAPAPTSAPYTGGTGTGYVQQAGDPSTRVYNGMPPPLKPLPYRTGGTTAIGPDFNAL